MTLLNFSKFHFQTVTRSKACLKLIEHTEKDELNGYEMVMNSEAMAIAHKHP